MRLKNSAMLMFLPGLAVSLVLLAGCEGREEEVPPPAEPATTAPAEPAAETTVDEATKVKFDTLVNQTTQHIRKGEFEGADTGLRELEKMSATLPESMRQQVATVRAALAAARAGGTTPAPGAAPAPGTQTP